MEPQDSTENRRPLKTRQWTFFRSLADRLARSGVTPNQISLLSILFACCSGIVLASTKSIDGSTLLRVAWIGAAALIQLRLIANLLDGMVAIEGGKKSAVGELYNEVPDRVSDPAILIGAGFAAGGNETLGLLAAVMALFVSYVRAIGASVGVGQVFAGPMAKQQRMALMTVGCVYCAAAPRAWQGPWWGEAGVMAGVLLVITLGSAVTAVRRLMLIAAAMRERADEGAA